MGWASGSPLGIEIYDKVREYIPENKREEVAKFIYDAVCDLDADDWDGDSDLERDAKIPVYCWKCDEEFQANELNEDGLCIGCQEQDDE